MDKNHIPKAPLFRSFYRAFRFHLGSIAFGSFLIAVVRIVRLLIWYIRKRASGTTNKVKAVRYILDCLACCMACLDRLVNWMNKNAYIHIAINGTSFCKAAHSAFQLIARNALRLLAVNFVAEYVLMLGKIAVAAAVFFATWAAMQSQQSVLQLNFTFVPGLIIAIESLIVSYVFLSVYQMVHLSLIFNLLFFSMIFNLLSLSMIFNPTNLYQTIDTIFLCFLEDSERNNGSSDKPYYMPQELLEIIDQKKAVNKTKEMEERHS